MWLYELLNPQVEVLWGKRVALQATGVNDVTMKKGSGRVSNFGEQ